MTIAACIGDFLVDFADLEDTVDVFDMSILYPIRPFPSSPFGDIFSNIFYGAPVDSLAPVVERAPVGFSRRGATAHGRAGEGGGRSRSRNSARRPRVPIHARR